MYNHFRYHFWFVCLFVVAAAAAAVVVVVVVVLLLLLFCFCFRGRGDIKHHLSTQISSTHDQEKFIPEKQDEISHNKMTKGDMAL